MAAKAEKPLIQEGAVSVADALVSALKDHGMDVAAARDASQVQGYLHTGFYALNWAISGQLLGGYPLGHVVELFSPPGVGKSYLLALALAEVQRAGGAAFLDDVERRLNIAWAVRAVGLRASLPVKASETVEEHRRELGKFIRIIRELAITKPCAVGLDSMALLSTEHELEDFEKALKSDKYKEKTDLARGKEVKKLFRLLAHDMSDLPMVYLVLNHETTSFDIYSRPESGGGMGTKFQASVRIGLQQSTRVKAGPESKEFIGSKVNVQVVKNSIVSPWRSTSFYIPFTRRAYPASGLIPLLLDWGVLTVAGFNLVYQEEDTGIKAHKSVESFVKQEESGRELLEKYPNLLKETDALLVRREQEMWGEVPTPKK